MSSNNSSKLDLKKVSDDLSGLYGDLAKLFGIVAGIYTAAVSFEVMKLRLELLEMMGKDWLKACDEDEECLKTMVKIAQECMEIRSKTPMEEKEMYRRKVLDELNAKLKELGIRIWCTTKDLGELGEFYDNCYIEYKGYSFLIDEVEGYESND